MAILKLYMKKECLVIYKEEKMEKFSEYMTEILIEMCNRVGTTVDKIDWDDDEWYRSHEWTRGEERDFEDWLVNYWYNNVKARRALTTCHKHKGRLRMAASEFILNYGWKLKLEK